VQIYLRLNLPREIEIAKQYRNEVHGFVLEAHIFEVFKRTFSNFLALRGYDTYIIDPVVYKFSLQDIIDQTDKVWYQNLVSAYHLELTEEQPFLNPRKISDAKIRDITKQVIYYQCEVVRNEIKRAAYQNLGLLQFLPSLKKPDYNLNPRAPMYVIPPYLIIEDTDNAEYRDYLKFNVKSIMYAKKLTKAPLLGIVAIGDEILQDINKLKEVLMAYLINIECDAYGVWVTGLNEATDKDFLLGRYVSLFLTLKRRSNKPVINLYGGYFSLILSALNILDGVVFGIGYAEYRDPRMEAGPVAVNRYYNPLTHTFESIRRMSIFYRLMPSLMCRCKVCKDKTPDQIMNLNLNELLIHFMENRMDEKRKLSALEKYSPFERYQHILGELKDHMERILALASREREVVGDLLSMKETARLPIRNRHLDTWIRIIEKLREFEEKA